MNPDTLKVLLVEDNEDDALLARAMLDHSPSTHFSVIHAPSYENALTLLSQTHIDLCLIDLKLNDNRSGLDLMHAAAYAGFKGPSIILTGTDDASLETQAIHGGAADYLVKGHIDPEMLERVIRHAIERQLARDEIDKVQRELQAARDELEDRVNRRTAELSKAVAALQTEVSRRITTEQQLRDAIITLERHNREKSEFVANVSHELKTPLTSIMYGTRNLLKGIAGPLPDQAIRYLKMFDSESERLVNTINHILDLGRIDNHALNINPIATPVGHLINRTTEPLRIQADAARVSLDIGINPAIEFIRCDPSLIQRVLQNILSNAVKFTPAGGTVTIRITSPDKDPGSAAISITDNGIGIPPDALNRVTERYFRVGTHISGTGLGLAISKEIMQLHGGSLDIASPPPDLPHGTRVTITLPLSPPPVIVIANNNLSVQALLLAQLTARGYEVESFTRGDTLLPCVTRSPPAMIVLDLLLEDMPGGDVILRLKESPATRYIPILAITGASVDEATTDLLERFTIPTLRKPWKIEELADVMESTLMGITLFQPLQQEQAV